jgi:phytoene dehydrogenase-like protein
LRAPRGDYDAVIVGGGHNALVAAAYLARAGRTCLLLERRDELGGAAVSVRAFAGVDARVSRYSYLVSLLPQLIVHELALPLRLARRRVSSYTPDPRAGGRRGLLVQARAAAATRDSFRTVTRGERAYTAWRELQGRLRRLARVVFPTLTQPLCSRAQLRSLIADEATWHAFFERPLGETLLPALGDELASGVALTDALIGTFAAAGEHSLRQNRCFLYHVIGRSSGEWLVPVGGMGALTAALAQAARRGGAELRTGTQVLAIAPDQGGVEVRFGDAQREHAVRAQHVLVGVAPAELQRLLGASPSQREVEGSQLKLNMLLARLPRLKDSATSPAQAFAGTFHVNETAEQLQHAYEQAAGGAIPELPPCEAYCHSLTDPSILAPELRAAGAHALSVFVLHMPARLFARDPDAARSAALAATLRSIDSVLAEPIAGCLLRDAHGELCLEVHSPIDLERELRMPGGHIFHRDLAWPFAEHDAQLGSWGVETEHPRVLLCGAGARRGGGVSGVPGRNAAMALLGR